jgi:hypothetical protein
MALGEGGTIFQDIFIGNLVPDGQDISNLVPDGQDSLFINRLPQRTL